MHPQLPHDPDRRGVSRLCDGYDALQSRALEAVAQSHSRGFRGQPAAPKRARQPPADFDLLRVRFLQGLQSAESDRPAAFFWRELPKAESALVFERDLAIHELPRALLGPRFAVADITHHLRIGGDGAEVQPVVRFPFAKDQSFGL